MGCDITSNDGKVEILGLSYLSFYEFKEKLLDAVCLRIGETIAVGTPEDAEFKAFKVFYEHHESDGVMTFGECARLADLLDHVVPLLSETETGPGRVGIWRDCGQRLLDGMRYCATNQQDARFH